MANHHTNVENIANIVEYIRNMDPEQFANTLGNEMNATPVHSAKIGKFQDTITLSKIIV